MSQSSYTLPATYQIFVAELQEACQQGDLCSKKAIEELAPQMATTLKEEKEGKYWENTDVLLEDVPPEMKCITSLSQVMPPEPGCTAAIITREIGPPSTIEEATVSNPLQEDDSSQAHLLM